MKTWVLVLVALALCPSAAAQSGSPAGLDERASPIHDAGLFQPIVFEGFVLEPGGAPAVEALVLSSAGGRAVTDRNGRYRFETDVALKAQSVQITAVGAAGVNCTASTSVMLSGVSGAVSVSALTLMRGSSCAPSWVPTFGSLPGPRGIPYAIVGFDDGSGPALYVGGGFQSAGKVAASNIAKWDGASWAALGSGVSDGIPEAVNALAVFDDGSGPALYAGGSFTTAGGVVVNNVARWDGASWSALGSGIDGGAIRTLQSLAVYDDGTGPALYAAGRFSRAGGVLARSIARWDGSTWSPLGAGVAGAQPDVEDLIVFDDGSGPALYAGGSFTSAGGVTANGIARWDGASWSVLESGVGGLHPWVEDLAVFDDGSGPALYAGGFFTTAGGVPANRVARWNGSTWSGLGSGTSNTVHALSPYDDGNGPALYAGGSFTMAGGASASRLAKWDGSGWAAVDNGIDQVNVLATLDDGGGAELYVGGLVDQVFIASWDGASWGYLDDGTNSWISKTINALAIHDDGAGPALYAGGDFTSASGVAVNCIAKWDGSSWTPLDSGISGTSESDVVTALAVYDDGAGPALHAGGSFDQAGGTPAQGIARWDGSSWTPLGSGFFGRVKAMTVYDDGSGPALFVGGQFLSLGGVTANGIARWDGTSWAGLGSGVSGGSGTVNALAVFDDGSGPALHAGGSFATAGGVPASNLTRWDGSSWAASGAGLNGVVTALTVFDDGSGAALHVAGAFTSAGGVPANQIARWDGSEWTALGTGLGGTAAVLRVHDDGSGPALYAGGSITTAGGVAVNNVAKWDGASWSALGSGSSSAVEALVTFDDGYWPALFVGGDFLMVFDSGDTYMAKWGCLDSPPTLSCPSAVHQGEQFNSPPGELVTFTVTATDDHDPSPTLLCVPPSGSFFPQGTTLVTCTATDASGNQSTRQFPVRVEIKARRLPR